jgi:hypothetical protein
LSEADFGELECCLEETITYYIRLISSVGGVERFLK